MTPGPGTAPEPSLRGARPLWLQLRPTLSHCLLCLAALHLLCTLQAVASAAQASLLRQQEELDRKAAELERKERELQNTVANLHGRGGRAAWLRTSLSPLVPGQPQSFAELCHGIVLGNAK